MLFAQLSEFMEEQEQQQMRKTASPLLRPFCLRNHIPGADICSHQTCDCFSSRARAEKNAGGARGRPENIRVRAEAADLRECTDTHKTLRATA
jgi:hypothetical protein